MDLFENQLEQNPTHAPLADRVRPKTFDEFFGHHRVLTQLSFLKKLQSGQLERVPNLILWGAPGTGKTTFAKILSRHFNADFLSVHAIDTGAKELKELGQRGRQRRIEQRHQLIVFIDEIHRLNRAQQDVLLPSVESGDLALIGATTENPSYELNKALLSRVRVLRFEPLTPEDLKSILSRATQIQNLNVDELLAHDAIQSLCQGSQGDARRMLNMLEMLLQQPESQRPLSKEAVLELFKSQPLPYDRAADAHYDTISAFIKSVRGSDPDAAVYYLARMLDGGEDPLFIARRLMILASEDIGNADPKALPLAVSAMQAVEMIGLPEGAIPLAQATTYLACCPKSNASYEALHRAQDLVKQHGALPIPLSLRSAQTALARQMGHGEGYKYSHQGARGYVEQTFLPEPLKNEVLYEPKELGFEKNLKEYLRWLRTGSKDT